MESVTDIWTESLPAALPGASNQEKLEMCKESERRLILSNPEHIGINFDHDFLVDARKFWTVDRWLQYYQEKDGRVVEEVQKVVDAGEAPQLVAQNIENERRKEKAFAKYLEGFGGKLQHARVHPVGEASPIAPSQAIEVKPDGSYEVEIAPEFIDQIKMLQEQSADLTVVVQFYDHRRGQEKASDVPETREQVDQYVAICDKILEKTGERIQLEIGNETNVSKETDARFAKLLQHASHVNPEEYGRFYFEVARRIKEIHPASRLSIAGVACYDPTYLREVLDEVTRLQVKNSIPEYLVDTISFHPYRENPDEGSVEVRNGKFTANSTNYEDQIDEMQRIASEFGVKLTVGEINFRFEDPEQSNKLEQAASLTTDKGIESLIYPGVNVH